MARKIVKIGVVGCGFIAQKVHIPIWLKNKNSKLVAICDVDEKLNASVAHNFHVKNTYDDFTEMLCKEKLDIIDLCTPINTHAHLSIQAMESGCNVIVEKPMSLVTKEADEMVKVAEKNKVKLCVIHNMLFLPTMIKIMKLIKHNTLGDITRVDIRHSAPPWDYPPVADANHWWQKLPGGLLGDSLAHLLYLMKGILGDIEPIGIFPNKVGTTPHIKFDDIHILVKSNSALGSMVYSNNWPSLWHIDVYGSKKIIHADLNNSFIIVSQGKTNMGKGIASFSAKENLSRSLQILSGSCNTAIKMLSGTHRGHPVLMQNFVNSIIDNYEPPVTAKEGREVVRLYEEITSKVDRM